MAKQVSDMPAGERMGPVPKYPWDEWLNGSSWLLVPGEDFTVEAAAFRGRVHAAARSRGMEVRTRVRPEGLYIQARPRDGREISGGGHVPSTL